MPILPTLGHLGTSLLASLLATAGAPLDAEPESSSKGPMPGEAPDRFQIDPADPRAADYQPRERVERVDDYTFPLTVSNHIIRVFGLERPHAYGLDVRFGASLLFEAEPVSMTVRPELGYAFVHHAEFDSHAALTGLGVCLLPHEPLSLCYTPSFVAGTETKARSLGLRHGLAFGFTSDYTAYNANLLEIGVQHGIAWIGAAGARHELRGALTVNLVELYMIIVGASVVGRIR